MKALFLKRRTGAFYVMGRGSPFIFIRVICNTVFLFLIFLTFDDLRCFNEKIIKRLNYD